MYLFTHGLRRGCVGVALLAGLAIPTLSVAQHGGRGGGGGGGGHSGGGGRGGGGGGHFGGGGGARGGGGGSFGGARGGAVVGGGQTYRSSSGGRPSRFSGGGGYRSNYGSQPGYVHGGGGFSGGVHAGVGGGYGGRSYGGGRGYTANAWRGGHPNWNGGYYYHNGGYFYDSGFGYPAIMTNEWGAIALLGGGIALASALDGDPTLFFAGSVGAFYSLGEYNSDEYGGGSARLRYDYFNRPYFWRSGVRYNRISVVSGGRRGYEFRRG